MIKNKAKDDKEPAIPSVNWRKRNGRVLVTNDFGYYHVLNEKQFGDLLGGRLDKKSPLFGVLEKKGFLRDMLDFADLAGKWKQKNSFLFSGTGLHIFVLTLRCNHKCVYCQSGAVGEKNVKQDMSWDVAKKSVEMAFKSPRNGITIEFQGGEPLCNWEVLKKTIDYARKTEKESGKNLKLALVSNFSLMDGKKADFLIKNRVSICTSLDGPRKIHNKNRIFAGGDSYGVTLKWLSYFKKRHDTQSGGVAVYKPSALLTVSKSSLGHAREIVDEYVRNGLETIFLRPLSPIGYAKKFWDVIGYEPEEFLSFYSESLKYVLDLNRKGVNIKEKTAQMLLHKILNFEDPGFLDLRCPCGASIGQLAYNYDGSIYTCDEGRMVGWEGDDFFKVGDAGKSSYKSIMSNSQTKGCVISSNLESQPMCFRCAYKPYCGVCPVVNYESQNSIWGHMPSNSRCKLFMGIFDILFDLLANSENEKIFKKWLG